MKSKNLKKLILLGMSCLLTANFSVLGMEEKNEINEIKEETNDININQIGDMDIGTKAKYSIAKAIYEIQKGKYESMTKIYERLNEENIENDTEKFMDDNHFLYIYDYYEKIIDYMGFEKIIDYMSFLNHKPEKEGYKPEKEGYYDENKKFHAPSYKRSAYKNLDNAINLIKNINHSEARRLIEQLKDLRQYIGFIEEDQKVFEVHFSNKLKTICYEAKYCLDYIEQITGVESNKRKFAKKFLEFLEELEKQKDTEEYIPNKEIIKEKFKDYRYDIKMFVKNLVKDYSKLKKIIEKTHTKGKKVGEDHSIWIPNQYAVCNVDDHIINAFFCEINTFDPEYIYEPIMLFSPSVKSMDYTDNVDMISEFLTNLEKMASDLDKKNLIK